MANTNPIKFGYFELGYRRKRKAKECSMGRN